MTTDPEIPHLLYGTAWKEERTAALVSEALDAGFRGIDTANQRKHYHEAGVGEALRRAFEAGTVTRDELFLQTKFTFRNGQDHRLPYDPDAPVEEQVAQSIESSLAHLGVEHLDAYVLHGPSRREGLGPADEAAWRAMEAAHDAGTVKRLGVSNVSLDQLDTLLDLAQVLPTFVQNRCYARRGWDADVRHRCASEGVVYQGFSLLTANRATLEHPGVNAIAERRGITVPQVVFAFARQAGMLPLTGTTDRRHMEQDLATRDIVLTMDDLEVVETAER